MLPGVLLAGAAVASACGAALGLLRKAGKHAICDATTSCAKTPHQDGYRSPDWPWGFFVAGGVLAGLALIGFVLLAAVRGRGRRAMTT
ncbi:hypothetical protein N4G70_09820 [Streptomyces sp. ASQP_92]|uniref:hypothetical protein n=1 Tax=Streptomyces sp. ASQP_92 TaxID=2979116 RepID=UPI0021BF4248|nr:hypothetical protein [Streptomyces sp. ASQP_92]MCT9089166.1 hypothetical protein [Streptomyces sp. ASQP_92]